MFYRLNIYMDWIAAIKQGKSKSDVCRLMNIPINGTGIRKVTDNIKKLNVDIDHFDIGSSKRKHQIIEKTCPVCENKFKTSQGSKKEKSTCSVACSNTYFRSGKDHGSWSGNGYRLICFSIHKKECVICGEDRMVDVHHYDENHNNNNIDNLIPLCPTHHKYMHSPFKSEFLDKINDFRKPLL